MLTALAHAGHEHTDALASSAPILAGLLTGALHILIGPDHLAAVAPLAVEQRRKPWIAGALWGIGHSAGMWVLAIAALAAREALPLDTISHWSETLVGISLVAVGLWGFHRITQLHVHSHEHTHTEPDGSTHTHRHTHVHATPNPQQHHHEAHPQHTGQPHAHSHALLGIGTLHGLAGTAHLLAILPALAMPDRTSAVAYVLAFGVGSIAGMSAFTTATATLAQAASQHTKHATRALLSLSSLAAVTLGAAWIIGI